MKKIELVILVTLEVAHRLALMSSVEISALILRALDLQEAEQKYNQEEE